MVGILHPYLTTVRYEVGISHIANKFWKKEISSLFLRLAFINIHFAIFQFDEMEA